MEAHTDTIYTSLGASRSTTLGNQWVTISKSPVKLYFYVYTLCVYLRHRSLIYQALMCAMHKE